MNRDEIDHYASGGEKVRLAVRGLTRDDLMTRPDPAANIGLWSIHQVIVHLADCEQVYADRIKRPTLLAFDENKWAKNLAYDAQPTDDAVAILELTRRYMARMLTSLSESVFARSGTHTEAGKQTVADLIVKANNHLDHHLKFVHQKRAAMGKEMW
jgi:uncharacterized damage-inducible protein DinB